MVAPIVIGLAFFAVVAGSMLLSGYYLSLQHKVVDLEKDEVDIVKDNDADQDIRDADMLERIQQRCIDEEMSSAECNALLMEYYKFIAESDKIDDAEAEPSILEKAAEYLGTTTDNVKYLIIAAILAVILTRG